MDRRNFLKNCGQLALAPYAAGGLASLFALPLMAAGNPLDDHYLVVIRIWGAMDCTLGLNPWAAPQRPEKDDLFLDENYKIIGAAQGTQLNLGPSAHALAPYAKYLSAVNGMFMGPVDLGHPFAQNYITSAKTSPDTPHLIAELAENYRVSAQLQKETILFDGQVRTFDLNSLSKLPLKILAEETNGESSFDSSGYPTMNFLGNHPLIQGHQDSNKVESQRQLFYRIKDGLAKRYPQPQANTSGNADTAEGENGSELNLDLALVAALAGGVARYAQADWNYQGRLDNHTNFPDTHRRGQKHAWDRLAKLLKVLSALNHPKTKKALFPNHVTLAVFTEFSRPPALNRNNGKDHNYFDNSILLGGRGIRGGKVIGDHHLFVRENDRQESQLSGCHIDYQTGAVVKNDQFTSRDPNRIIESADIGLIRPENVLRTLGDVFNVDYRLMRLFSKATRPLPGLT